MLAAILLLLEKDCTVAGCMMTPISRSLRRVGSGTGVTVVQREVGHTSSWVNVSYAAEKLEQGRGLRVAGTSPCGIWSVGRVGLPWKVGMPACRQDTAHDVQNGYSRDCLERGARGRNYHRLLRRCVRSGTTDDPIEPQPIGLVPPTQALHAVSSSQYDGGLGPSFHSTAVHRHGGRLSQPGTEW